MKKLCSLLLALSMVLALVACGGNNANDTNGGDSAVSGGDPLEDLVVWKLSSSEFSTFLVHHSENANEDLISGNCYTPLLEVNNKGQLQPSAATEWGSDDGGLTWTFKLRDDITWVDYQGNEKAKCTARDWLSAMEWILNYYKNSAYNTSMPNALIEGAQDYYNYTKELTEAEALALTYEDVFAEMVGIEAPDDYTLIYHCTKNAPYFDTLTTCVCLYPLPQGMLDELGSAEKVLAVTNDQLWYNGPYTITTYVHANEKIFTRNDSYWDKDATLFNSVRVIMIDDGTIDDQLYETGEVDQADLSESTLLRIYEDESHPLHDYLVEKRAKKYSYQIHFNYNKMNSDGTVDTNYNTAIANTAFRQSLLYGLDLRNYWARTNAINPMSCENVAYTMKGLLYFSDGTDYTTRVIEGLGYDPNYSGDTPQRLDMDKALALKEQAMSELEGRVTFPVKIDYYIKSGDQTALDSAYVIKEIFEALGTDYIELNICTYISSSSQEVTTPGLHSIAINGWGADFGDVENFIGQYLYADDAAGYANRLARINNVDPEAEPELISIFQEFTDMANEASQIYTDLDARYEAYAKAEIYMLENALVIPCSYNIGWQLTKINDYNRSYCLYGAQNESWKNLETNANGYTTEDYEAFRAEFYGN